MPAENRRTVRAVSGYPKFPLVPPIDPWKRSTRVSGQIHHDATFLPEDDDVVPITNVSDTGQRASHVGHLICVMGIFTR